MVGAMRMSEIDPLSVRCQLPGWFHVRKLPRSVVQWYQVTESAHEKEKVMSRAALTTKQGKAKCLRYRNGKRCGRIGKILVKFQDRTGWHSYPVCRECAGEIVSQGGEILETSDKGWQVASRLFFPDEREYISINRLEAEKEQDRKRHDEETAVVNFLTGHHAWKHDFLANS